MVKLNYILFDQSVILLFIFYFIEYWSILKSFEVGISNITSELNTSRVSHTFEWHRVYAVFLFNLNNKNYVYNAFGEA